MSDEAEKLFSRLLAEMTASRVLLDGKTAALLVSVEEALERLEGEPAKKSFRDAYEEAKRERMLEALAKIEEMSGPAYATHIKSLLRTMDVDPERAP